MRHNSDPPVGSTELTGLFAFLSAWPPLSEVRKLPGQWLALLDRVSTVEDSDHLDVMDKKMLQQSEMAAAQSQLDKKRKKA